MDERKATDQVRAIRRAARALRVALILLMMHAGAAIGQETPGRVLHLYLLAGQSNMAGRGLLSAVDTVRHPRVYALSDSMTWRLAYEPVHFDKPDIAGVGPGFAFGKAMADIDSTVVIGLIPAAVGGSLIESWQPGAVYPPTGSRPYDDAISRTFRVLALYGGTLEGIVWHQGESNQRTPPQTYIDELIAMITRFRTDFQIADLPFVAGGLPPRFVEENPGGRAINAAISSLPSLLGNTAVVDAHDLSVQDDGVHFDSASARTLGSRYAQAITALQEE